MQSSDTRVEPPRHTSQCMCKTCEQFGSGHFAERAALAGDSSAAERLSAPVFLFLKGQARPRKSWFVALRVHVER